MITTVSDFLIKLISAEKQQIDSLNITHRVTIGNMFEGLTSITSKGTKYWKINYDLSTIRKFARFDKIDFADHIKPIHKVYLKRNNLPDKFSLVGGGKYGTLVILKSDAEALADLLFDLLIEIHNLDQEKFDENPEYIRNGRNAQGLLIENNKENSNEQ